MLAVTSPPFQKGLMAASMPGIQCKDSSRHCLLVILVVTCFALQQSFVRLV